MKKRICSLVLAFVIVASCCVPSYASADNNQGDITRFESSYLYTNIIDNKAVAIIVDDDPRIIEVAISDCDDRGIVYKFNFGETMFTNHSVPSYQFWNEVVSYCFANIEISEMKTVEITHLVYDNPIDITNMRDSATADLTEQLITLVGPTYANNVLYSQTIGGNLYQVKEQKTFSIYLTGTDTWKNGLDVASYIVTVLGLVSGNAIVQAICTAFGLAISAGSMLPDYASMNYYSCDVRFLRYTVVNNSAYMYTTAYEFVVYRAYEDARTNSINRAQIDSSSRNVSYNPSSLYFNSYATMVDDAYALFQSIGQKG